MYTFNKSSLITNSAKADMTLPNVVNDLFMLAPSFSRVPCAPVESARSDPIIIKLIVAHYQNDQTLETYQQDQLMIFWILFHCTTQ